MMNALDHRAIGALMFLFALPNTVPLLPGMSTVLGAPLLFLTAQLCLGRRPWLPKALQDRAIGRARFATLVARTAPTLRLAERLLKARCAALVRPPVEYLIGAVCFVLAIILFLPIPMGNMPPAIAICLFGLAIAERDGVWVILGFVAALCAIAIVWGVAFALIEGGMLIFARAFH